MARARRTGFFGGKLAWRIYDLATGCALSIGDADSRRDRALDRQPVALTESRPLSNEDLTVCKRSTTVQQGRAR